MNHQTLAQILHPTLQQNYQPTTHPNYTTYRHKHQHTYIDIHNTHIKIWHYPPHPQPAKPSKH